MKTIEDYMNDPDIIDEPLALREIYAIRLKIYEETKDISPAEYNKLVGEKTQNFFSKDFPTEKIPEVLTQ